MTRNTAKDFLDGYYITNEGVKYYECQYSPYNTDGLELLSDVSNLEFTDDQNDFE